MANGVGGAPGSSTGWVAIQASNAVLNSVAEPVDVEVGELAFAAAVGIRPGDERGDVDLGLRLRPGRAARAASILMALVRPAALACSPFQRVAW